MSAELNLHDNVEVYLLNPPIRDSDIISNILVQVHFAKLDDESFSVETINGIVKNNPFSKHKLVKSYFPYAPNEWADLPVELEVNIALSEGAGLYHGIFEEFKRDTLREAMSVVCGSRFDGLLIGYTLQVRNVVPFLGWNVDWALARQGKEKPYRRERVQGNLPFEDKPDVGLFTIYQNVKRVAPYYSLHYFDEPTIRLTVGGANSDQAVFNWQSCARYFRTLKKSL